MFQLANHLSMQNYTGRAVCLCIAIVLALLGSSAPLYAAPQINPVDLSFKTVDLIYKTENLKGAVIDLEVKETETEVKIELSGDVLFDFDKWDIRKEAEPVLANVGEIIKKYPASKGEISGHTDSKGADDYNMNLSRKRAESVKKWLVASANLNAGKFSTRGLGETKPAVPNSAPDGSDDPDGRQKNRRVEILVRKKG